jgi:nucleotide-binding universal stress UspA family protein
VASEAGAEVAELAYDGTWHAILDVAAQRDAPLLVLGARGLSTFTSVVPGSVSHSVAQHAQRPVLTVPPANGNDACVRDVRN